MKVTQTELEGVLILEYELKEDNRGTSYKLISKPELEEAGITTEFVEEILYSPEKKDTLYGIHFQNNPKPQTKLLTCIKGRGLDFAVDLRKESKQYKQWICVELSAENRKQVYIPHGYGHAFLSLEDHTQMIMRIDQIFDPEFSRAITYTDPELNIDFPVINPVLSEMDTKAPTLKECNINL